MSILFGSILENSIKFVIFIGIAVIGVICGKKYRVYKDSKNTGLITDKENK